MKKLKLVVSLFIILILAISNATAQQNKLLKVRKNKDGKTTVVNTGIDNLGYWMNLAKQGYVPYNPVKKSAPAKYLGSRINSSATDYEDSPDILIHDGNNTQTEISVFVDPNDNQHILNSNNSTDWSGSSVSDVYGTSGFFSSDGAETWNGDEHGTGGQNNGDPATAIDLDGKLFVGAIANGSMQQNVSYSLNDGTTWTSVITGSSSNLDKNHLWVDNSPTSPYKGYLYDAWTNFNNSPERVEVVRSTDHGLTWSTPKVISNSPFDHGVNLSTDAQGNVYAVWAEYNGGGTTEDAYGMSKSTDGGATWSAVNDIITNVKGIRSDQPLAHRVNSFPVMAIDMLSGNIYVVWANYGVPGTNTGDWINVYMIKSTNQGNTWSTPIQVSQSPNIDGTYSYLPWITCDPSTGYLGVIFYDNRNCTGDDAEAWVATSMDEGDTWEDFRVSDVSFTTQSISGLASGYMGDYLGITSLDAKFYPVWTDNRDGVFRAYTSPFSLNLKARPIDFDATITDQQTGKTDLIWSFTDTSTTFSKFIIYRDGAKIDSTTDTTYIDMLPSYGEHKYQVSAMHTNGESSKVSDYVNWGKAIIAVNPTSLTDTLASNQTSVHNLTITNNGKVDLIFNLKTSITNKYRNTLDYCSADGGGDEYISGVVFGDINNTGTSESGYSDYTNLSTDVNAGETYQLTVTNGNPYDLDDWGVWIDWNQDGDFDDADENPVCEVAEGANNFSWDITIPTDALAGETRMRIRLKYSGGDCGEPCGSTTYGEVEDYSINIIKWIKSDVPTDTVTVGETITIPVTFDATDCIVGTYQATMHISSNAANSATVDIPATMVVMADVPLSSNAVAVPNQICSGESVNLYSNVIGGTGSYTYSWTDNNSFTSTDKNPVVSPTETTTYYLTANDSTNTVNSEVTIFVTSDLQKPTKPNGKTTIGNDNNVIKYSTLGSQFAYSYEWTVYPTNAGNIVGTTDTAFFNPANDFIGTAYLKVRAINDCGMSEWSDSLEINIIEGTTSIPTNEISISAYPNPTDGLFILSLNSENEDYLNIEIYNMSGQIVYSDLNHYVFAFNSMQIDLSEQPAGMYIIHISGNYVNKNIKIIVE